jgi:hypothetical protein
MCVAVLLAATSALVFMACESGTSDDTDTTATSGALTISPTSAVIPAGVTTSVVFYVSGGTSPYAWAVNSSSYGTLVASGSQATYSSTLLAGRNYITVTDSSTNSVTATVDHN